MTSILLTRRTLLVASLCVFLAGALLYGSTSVALAQEPSPISVKLEVGFEGKVRAGRWIPVAVLLENRGPDFQGEVHVGGVIGDPGSSVRYVADVVLPRDSRKRLTLYAQPSFPRLRVYLVSDGTVVTRLEHRLNFIDESDLFVGVVGARAGALNLLTTLEVPGGGEIVVVPVPPDTFPQHPEALGAFDVIALGNVPVQTLSAGALEALEGWVTGGGTLVLSSGSNVKRSLKGLPERLMPVVPGDATELESASALERLGNEPFLTTLPLRVRDSEVLSGHVLAQEGEVPLAVLSRSGQGSVLFLAFDPVVQPFASWLGMPNLWKELLFQSLPSSVLLRDRDVRQFGRLGTRYSSFQPYSAMYNLPALEFPSINLLLGLIVGYILLVGPINYLVLRRLRRPGLMWITIPALVLMFSGSAYMLAVRAKGSDVQVSTISIIQEAPGTDWARVRRTVAVLVPARGDYQVHVHGSALIAPWDSYPWRLASGRGSSGETEVTIRNGREGSELELPNMGMWTMRGLWTDSVQRVEELLSYDLYVDGSRLKGTVTNSSPVPLKQVWLIAGDAVGDLGILEPGESAIVDAHLMGSSTGQTTWRPLQEHLIDFDSVRSSDSIEARTREQVQQAIMAATESLHTSSPFDPNLYIMMWTDESPMGVTVNGVEPDGSSITVLVKPITPRLRRNFSLPNYLTPGRIVNVEGKIIEDTDPGAIPLTEGSIDFQFEVGANFRDIRHATLQIPLLDGSMVVQGVEALAYNWEYSRWEPLGLKEVFLPSLPQSPSYDVTMIETLRGDLGDGRRLTGYMSDTGLIRVKLVVSGTSIGVPSLAIEGVAP